MLQRFESLLLTPATILGTSTESGLNQKNSTSLTLGTQTAFDFYPPKTAGGQAPRYSRRLCPKTLNGARKNLSNLVLNVVTYLWDITLEVVLKALLVEAIPKRQITPKDKARADPPSLKSYGGTGEKAESEKYSDGLLELRSGFKTSDQAQEQGANR